MKKIFLSIFGCMMSLLTFAYEPIPTDSCQVFPVDLSCQIRDHSTGLNKIHRTSPAVPNIYLDQENSKVYFENPCYECTLELVIPDTETTVYTTIIPDGDNTVQLPTYLTGQFELHIHRGIYCFWGLVELP